MVAAMSKSAVIVIITALILAVVGGAVYIILEGKQGTSLQDEKKVDTTDWEIYKSSELGFQFSYPDFFILETPPNQTEGTELITLWDPRYEHGYNHPLRKGGGYIIITVMTDPRADLSAEQRAFVEEKDKELEQLQSKKRKDQVTEPIILADGTEAQITTYFALGFPEGEVYYKYYKYPPKLSELSTVGPAGKLAFFTAEYPNKFGRTIVSAEAEFKWIFEQVLKSFRWVGGP